MKTSKDPDHTQDKKEKKRGQGHCVYIINQSLYSHLSAFKRIGLKIPEKNMIQGIEAELLDELKNNLSLTEKIIQVETQPFQELCDQVLSLAHESIKILSNRLVVSPSPILAYESGGIGIGLSRLVSPNGDIIARGPRPGYASVNKQINTIAEEAKRRPLVIIEDGAFTGKSMAYLIELLQERNIEVGAVILGILFPEAEPVIRAKFKGKLIFDRKADNVIDWMPTHDFFPFVPNAGRPIGTWLGKSCFPVYLHNGIALSKPYILPYGHPKQWANIQGDTKHIAQFSRKCLWLTLKIFKEMEKINNKTIRIEDLVESHPRTNLPTSSGQYDFVSLSERVIDIINGDLKFLS